MPSLPPVAARAPEPQAAATQAPATSTQSQQPGLDLLRFVSAFAVAAGHIRAATYGAYGSLPAGDKTPFAAAFYLLTRLGGEAVIVFFVLSGYLIGGRYFTKIAQGTFNALDYGIDRAVRIGLPLIPALVLTAGISLIQGGDTQPLLFLVNAMSLQGVVTGCCYGGNAPLWSLPYEVWLYVLVLVVGLWFDRGAHGVRALLSLTLLALVFAKLEHPYLLCWLLGAAAYALPPPRAKFATLALAIALLCIGVAGHQFGLDSVSVSQTARAHWSALLPGLATSKVLLGAGAALLVQQAAFWRPSSEAGHWIARAGTLGAGFSFSLYLTHWPLLYFATVFGLAGESAMTISAFIKFASMCMFSIVVAWCFYWAFESRTSTVRGWIKRAIASRSTGQLSPDRAS